MGYMHIENLYKPEAQRILDFKTVFAMEKVHGTSAHVAFRLEPGVEPIVRYHSGGETYERFRLVFDHAALTTAFVALGHPGVVVYGEAYGGKQQGMKHTYGENLRFIAFDVQINGVWLSVPDAADVARRLGLDFVPYRSVPATLDALDAERDRPSEVGERYGTAGRAREGIVIRPPWECSDNRGRIIAKHKGAAFRETATHRIVDPGQLAVLRDAQAVASEWVTPMRLTHVLDALRTRGVPCSSMEHTRTVIDAMVEDVQREGAGEIAWSKDVEKQVAGATARLFKATFEAALRAANE